MTGWSAASLLWAGAALLVSAPSSARRLAALGPHEEVTDRVSSQGRRAAGSAESRPWAAPMLVVSLLVLIAALVPGVLGLLLAAPAAAAGHRWFTGRPQRSQVARGAAVRRQLPMLLELVGAALRAGATTDAALALAADAVGPPVEAVLREVVAGLRLGASADEAWRPAQQVEGLQSLARLAVRSEVSGATMAGACVDLAGRERSHRRLAAQAAVKRAGVWAVLPLALCFLPAFVLVGVVPVVVGLLQSVAL